MKTQLKRLLAVMLIVVLAASLTACGGFDAPTYVKGTLDGIFHGEANPDYLKITGETADEVTDAHETILRTNADSFCEAAGLDESMISDAAYEKIVEMSRILYNKTQYTVGKAKKVDGGYEVAVTIEPVKYDMSSLSDKVAELQNEYVDKINSGEYSFETQGDIDKMLVELVERIVDLCVDQANNTEYLPAVEETVKLVQNGNVVSVADGEIERLESVMLNMG